MLDRAHLLRREMTLPERLLWREIRARRLGPQVSATDPHGAPPPPRGGRGQEEGSAILKFKSSIFRIRQEPTLLALLISGAGVVGVVAQDLEQFEFGLER